MKNRHNIFLLYPHQLFENIEKLQNHKVLLIEEPLFFTLYKFHIQKLVMHRASMRYYFDYLKSKAIECEYFEDESYLEIYKEVNVTLYDVADNWLEKKIQNNFKYIQMLPSPNFFNVDDNNKFLHKFYINRRKELGVLLDESLKPLGGKWSFDSENRKKLPSSIISPKAKVYNNSYIEEAKEYVKKFETVGSCYNFYYPITHKEAKENLEYFLEYKFQSFGDYQDAIVQNDIFVYHSNISSSLNIGLLDLKDVIDTILRYDAPLNAKEGYIRQIIGWREFMLSIYKSSHIKMRNSNFFGFSNHLSSKLLNGKTGLKPFDDAIKKLYYSSYNHHIERLMIIGNLFLLLEIIPNEVYQFFMSNYIDAYDWVMVANVYGMSGFSDGGSITTKPYFSSSNYIVKMSSDYKKTQEWCVIWDALYWRFLYTHRDKFITNIRMRMQFAILDKMPQEKLLNHIQVAQNFIKEIL